MKNVALLYIVTAGLIYGVLALPGLIAHKPAAVAVAHACKVQTVEVTKTEGDLTWTDIEQVCM